MKQIKYIKVPHTMQHEQITEKDKKEIYFYYNN